MVIDPMERLTVETDVSESVIGALLSQCLKLVAFFSRSLNKSERHYSPVKKEAYAIVEALRTWRHFLIGKQFLLLKDQKALSFMFNQNILIRSKMRKLLDGDWNCRIFLLTSNIDLEGKMWLQINCQEYVE
uniref:Reverse transcriptase RNase H-like domain-containing protein n=1 Tax=Lepeophtheirus salmonis TaxID=72036 RepID=A0A0K2V2G3_LEPSM